MVCPCVGSDKHEETVELARRMRDNPASLPVSRKVVIMCASAASALPHSSKLPVGRPPDANLNAAVLLQHPDSNLGIASGVEGYHQHKS